MDPINRGEVTGSTYRCAYCGEINHTFVDPSQGSQQKYIEDCPRCIRGRPNELHVSYDEWNKEYVIHASQSQ